MTDKPKDWTRKDLKNLTPEEEVEVLELFNKLAEERRERNEPKTSRISGHATIYRPTTEPTKAPKTEREGRVDQMVETLKPLIWAVKTSSEAEFFAKQTARTICNFIADAEDRAVERALRSFGSGAEQ